MFFSFKETLNKFILYGLIIGFLFASIEVVEGLFIFQYFNFSFLEKVKYFIYSCSTITFLLMLYGFVLGAFFALVQGFTKYIYSLMNKDKVKTTFETFKTKFYFRLVAFFGIIGLVAFNFVFTSSKDNSTFFTALFKLIQNDNTYFAYKNKLIKIPFFAHIRFFFRENFNIEIVAILLILIVFVSMLALFFVFRVVQKKFSYLLKAKNAFFKKGILYAIAFLILCFYYIDSNFYRNLYEILHTTLKTIYITITFIFFHLLFSWFPKLHNSFLIKKSYLILIVSLALIFTSVSLESNKKIKASIFKHTELIRFSIKNYQLSSDFDKDGYSSFFDGGDLDNFNPKINPTASDIPRNFIDENALGGDLNPKEIKKINYSNDFQDFFADSTFVPNHIKNVIIIHIDALRADRMLEDKYDYLLPNFKEFASISKNFTKAYAQGSGTRASIHPMRAMSYNQFRPVEFNSIRPSIENFRNTLDSIMVKMPYKFLDYESNPALISEESESLDIFPKLRNIMESTDDSLFITLFISDTHYPHQNRDFGYPKTLVGRYDSEVKFFDENLGKFLDYFWDSNFKDNTIIVIFADHGEELLDHGGLFHGVSLYEELIKVPLVIYYPNCTPQVIDNYVEILDIYPTIFELSNWNLRNYNFRESKSLVPLMEEGKMAHKKYIQSSRCYHSVDGDYSEFAIIDSEKELKLIVNLKYFTFELYDLKNDPLEKNNLIDLHREEAKELESILDLTLNGYRIN